MHPTEVDDAIVQLPLVIEHLQHRIHGLAKQPALARVVVAGQRKTTIIGPYCHAMSCVAVRRKDNRGLSPINFKNFPVQEQQRTQSLLVRWP